MLPVQVQKKNNWQRRKSIYELIDRTISGYSDQFNLEIIQEENSKSVFEITSKGEKVNLKGNNTVSISHNSKLNPDYAIGVILRL